MNVPNVVFAGKKKPTVISTFAGCGGSSLGYQLAGFRELLAVEWNKNAIETFKANFPGIPIFHDDIAKLSSQKCMDMAGINKGELDILDGSPPCQGFSTAGRRKLNDERNILFMEFARLLRDLQPKIFVMENVTGLIKGYMKQTYLEIIKTLRKCGYRANGQVMNAMYYGVPQSRERVIIIGTRKDLNIEPTYPKPQTKPIIFREAIKNIKDYCDREVPDIIKKYAKIHPNGKWNTDIKKYKKIKGNHAGAISLKWAQWNKICGTLPKQEIALTGIIHPNRRRYLNLDEAKRIASFPDTFIFTGRLEGWKRIGNAVPPLLMKAIALHIKQELLKWDARQN